MADSRRIPPALQQQLDAIARRKNELDAKLAVLRNADATQQPSPRSTEGQPAGMSTDQLPAPRRSSAAASQHASSSAPDEIDESEREFFSKGYLAIDAARQSLISASSQRAPPPHQVAAPLPPFAVTSGPDPFERARAALGRSSIAQAESTQIIATREALRERIAAEGAELADAEARLVDASGQLEAVRGELISRTSEVEALRAQLAELAGVTSELLRVVDPGWHALRSGGGAGAGGASGVVGSLALQPQQPLFWDAAAQAPAAGAAQSPPSLLAGPLAPTASSYDALLARLERWAARHDAALASF